MKKYIEQEAAIHAIEYRITKLMKDPEFRKKRVDIDLYGAKENILKIPAADVVEVRHGRWVNIVHAAVDTTGDCDQCHCKSVWRTREIPYVICPHCGARMDGGTNNATD